MQVSREQSELKLRSDRRIQYRCVNKNAAPAFAFNGTGARKRKKSRVALKRELSTSLFPCFSATAYKISHFSSICKWKYRNKVSKIKNVNMQRIYTKTQRSIQKQMYQLLLTFTLNIIFLHSVADIFGAIYSLILFIWQFQSSIERVANQIPARTHTLKTCLLHMLFFY